MWSTCYFLCLCLEWRVHHMFLRNKRNDVQEMPKPNTDLRTEDWLTPKGSREESMFFGRHEEQTLPQRPCQNILKPPQRAYSITDIHINYTETHRKVNLMFQRSDRNIAEALNSSDFFNSPCTCKAAAEMTNVTHSFKAHSVLHMWLLNPVFRTVFSVYWALKCECS